MTGNKPPHLSASVMSNITKNTTDRFVPRRLSTVLDALADENGTVNALELAIVLGFFPEKLAYLSPLRQDAVRAAMKDE
jgi:hypothetical protein